MSKIFHPLLALIASATDKALAEYVEYLKHENKIMRARLRYSVRSLVSLFRCTSPASLTLRPRYNDAYENCLDQLFGQIAAYHGTLHGDRYLFCCWIESLDKLKIRLHVAGEAA
jgi:hypothetical protein